MVVASLLATTSFSYYLFFAIPVAAILLRDLLRSADAGPERVGVLDPARVARGIGVASSFALVFETAATITRVVLPFHVTSTYGGAQGLLATSGDFAPFVWTIALVMALWSNLARCADGTEGTDSLGSPPEAPPSTKGNVLSDA